MDHLQARGVHYFSENFTILRQNNDVAVASRLLADLSITGDMARLKK